MRIRFCNFTCAYVFVILWCTKDRWSSGRRQQTVNLPVNSHGGSNPSLPKICFFMFNVFSEWSCLCVIIVLGVFLFFDEEPLFDPTDWNIVHVLLFLICLWIVVWENIVRARYGQFVYKDQVLVFSTFSFWFALENYSRLIVIIFCFHCLAPLDLDLVELVEVYQTLMSWYTTDILPLMLLLVLIFSLTLLNNFFFNWQNSRVVIVSTFTVILILTLNILMLLWDFLFTSMSGCLFFSNPKEYYTHGRSSLTYDMTAQTSDAYDWHKSQPQSFVFRFEDLYLFFLQLFNIIALYSCIFVWLFFFQDLLANSGNTQVSLASSITFFGVCVRWLDHALWCFLYSHLAILFVGFRVILRVSMEVTT